MVSPPAPTRIESLNDLRINADYRPLLLANGLDRGESLFTVPFASALEKPGLAPWRQRLMLTCPTDHPTSAAVQPAPETLFLKRFVHPPPAAIRSLRHNGWGASSHAGLEWAIMLRLAELGVPVAAPVALFEQVEDGREIRSAILTAGVPGNSLERLLQAGLANNRPGFEVALAATARVIAGFHRLGFVHRDLYASHVFYDPTVGGPDGVHLIDLQRVFRPRWRRIRWIVKDLASLNYSAQVGGVAGRDRMRWLRFYLEAAAVSRRSRRRWVRRIAAKTRRIARHDAARRRRVE